MRLQHLFLYIYIYILKHKVTNKKACVIGDRFDIFVLLSHARNNMDRVNSVF